MMLENLITSERIIPELKATERWGAISEIVDFLVQDGAISPENQEIVVSAIRRREETISTGIGFGIAIPHASCECVSEVITVFARSTQGIDFDSLDNTLINFIVLFIVPKDQFQDHLRTLAAIAKLLNDPVVRKEIAEAPDKESIFQVFLNHSQNH